MRLKIYLISILLLGSSIEGYSCWYGSYHPREYLLYRVYEPNSRFFYKNHYNEIPALENLGNPEVAKYMELAKCSEEIRAKQNSKWYYPSKGDKLIYTLEGIVDESLSYEGEPLRDRYALQAARAMFALGRFVQLKEWWSENGHNITNGVVKDNIKGYVAGAMFRTGEQEEAMGYYVQIQDFNSIVYCLKKMGTYSSRQMLEYLAKHCPDAIILPELMQEYFRNIEYEGRDTRELNELYRLCINAASSPHCTKPVIWLYTAAFLKERIGQPYIALNIINKAECFEASEYLEESLNVLKILVEAQISTYNKAYEKKLLDDLQWLDSKIVSEMCDPVASETVWGWSLKNSHSYYYWNDMLRKILIGTVVPRMLEAYKAPLAILLANYADNRLLYVVEKYLYKDKSPDPTDYDKTITEIRQSAAFNMFDYSNYFFSLLDELDIAHLKTYKDLSKDPISDLEKFLCDRGYINEDYINDIIGTRYLRDMDYGKAEKYLSKVSKVYKSNLNVKEYFNRNPFSFYPAKYNNQSEDYKLDFAKAMLEFERTIEKSSCLDSVGKAMVMKGVGIHSSFGYCWALTHYGKSFYEPWFESDVIMGILNNSEKMISAGLKMIEDREVAAECYRILEQWEIITEQYPDTDVGKVVLSKCDRLRDYINGI